MERVKKFFKIEERGSSIKAELIGGLVTYLAMAYILGVNPSFLSTTGMPVGGIFVATAVASAIATLVMGLFANYPIALAPGMGVNALFAFTVCGVYGYTWQEALVAVLISGVIFLIISILPIRKMIINSVPTELKKSIGAGIGLFIAFIGLQNAGIIVNDDATLVTLGNLTDPGTLLAIFGILLAFGLYASKTKFSKFAIIISMITTAVVGFILGLLGVEGMPTFSSGYQDLGTFSETLFGFTGGFATVFNHVDLWFVIFTFLFLDLFDTAGTLIAVSEPAGLLDDKGELENIDKALLADAIGTAVGAVVGTSTVTSYVESSTGIESGAKTGLSAVVVGILFLLSIVLFPVFSIFIEYYKILTPMALVLVGVLMMGQLKGFDWDDKASVLASFVIMITMVLSYSIGNGIALGFIVYVIAMLVQRKGKNVSPVMFVLAAAFVVYFLARGLMSL